jgi:hypothetical protein
MNLKIFISALLIFLVALKLSAQESSIIYNDYNPDLILKRVSDSFLVDVNEDSIADVMFYTVGSSVGNWYYVKPVNSNCQFSLINYYPSDSLKNDSIIWHTETVCILGEQTYNYIEKIGIRIASNNQYYFGWIKAFFTKSTYTRICNIDKYAFCTIPDYPLLWGQTELTGAKEIDVQDKVKVSVDGQSKNINIQSKEVVKEISLINYNGRVIQKWRNLKSSKVDIPAEEIKGGIYLIRIKNMNNEVFTDKVVL